MGKQNPFLRALGPDDLRKGGGYWWAHSSYPLPAGQKSEIGLRLGDPGTPAALAHEIGHMKLRHTAYPGDLPSKTWKQEVDAWEWALKRGPFKKRAKRALEKYKSYLAPDYPESKMEKDMRKLRLNPTACLSAQERRKLQSMMRRLGISRIKVTVNPCSGRDIAVYLSKPPHVICGRKWMSAPYHERMKRMCHELLHCKGMSHDSKSRAMGYFSNPARDIYSSMVYRVLGGG